MHLARPQRDARIYALSKCTMGRIDWCRELQQMIIIITVIIVRNRDLLESRLLRGFFSFSHAPYGHMHKVTTEGPILLITCLIYSKLGPPCPTKFRGSRSQGTRFPSFHLASLPRPLNFSTSTTRSANRQVRHAQHSTTIESAAGALLTPACQHAIL